MAQNGVAMDDASWQNNCEMLARSLRTLAHKTVQITRSTNKILTIKDMQKEREKVKQLTSNINHNDVPAIQQELRVIERAVQDDQSLNGESMRLIREAENTLDEFATASDEFYRRCIQVEQSSRGRSVGRARRSADEEHNEQEDGEAVGDRTRSNNHARGGNRGKTASRTTAIPTTADDPAAPTQRLMFERDLYDDIMLERQRETQEIADNVRDIHEIFLHINAMVDEQGTQLEIVDNNLDGANRASRNAASHLAQAYRYHQSSPRAKYLLILIIILIIIVALMLLRS